MIRSTYNSAIEAAEVKAAVWPPPRARPCLSVFVRAGGREHSHKAVLLHSVLDPVGVPCRRPPGCKEYSSVVFGLWEGLNGSNHGLRFL